MNTNTVTAISTGFCRINEVCATLSIGRTTVWRMVKDNRLPQPVRPSPFGKAICVWKRDDIAAFCRGEWQPDRTNDATGG